MPYIGDAASMQNKLRLLIRRFSKYTIFYDVFMSLLAIAVVVILFIDQNENPSDDFLTFSYLFDRIVWIIFCADYMVRLLISENKFKFVRSNIVDLIAIFPFDAVFQEVRALRLVKLILMLRAFAYLNRAYKRVSTVLKTNDFDHVLWFTFCIVFFGAIAISYIDNMNVEDALWWSFVTTTTVGYGDIAPTSTGGRFVAVFLMLVGIGFLSTLTGTISSFFIKHEKMNYQGTEIHNAIQMLQHFDELSKEDVIQMNHVLLALKESKE